MNGRTDQPKFIAHYRVARHLGSGGMGEVFLAEDTKLDRSVALKLLPREVAADASRRKRFLGEAKAASALNHSNVCTIYEVGETAEGQPYIAMEYLEGQTLDALARRRRLELREIVGIGVQVAEALEAAHQHQVVHRDIKPGNIMVDAQGRVKVVDFGLAKRLDREGTEPTLTQEGTIIGTPNYLSPELALGREVDSRSDIFSLGVVLYELAAGQKPFGGASFGETVNHVLNHAPAPMRPWNPTLTPEFERIVFKCLEKDPAKRYGTAAQLRDDLTKLQATFQAPRRSNRLVPGTAAIVVGLAVVGLGALWLTRSGPMMLGLGKAVPRITSLAVKPLDDFSGTTNDAYLSDNMTEALSTALGEISALQVRGRSSVMRYKGGQKSIREMANDLNVDAIVEGSVQRADNRILVTVKLIEAATDRQLWAEKFERDLGDFFKVQSEIARIIAGEIQVRLTPEDQARLTRARTAKPETVEACLLGMRGIWLASEEGITNALRHFQRAIEIEPDYAPAHAGLALAYIYGSTFVGLWAPTNGIPKGKAAAQRAIQLDPLLPDAYVALGYVRLCYDWDWAGAESEFKRALELRPRSSLTQDGYANFLGLRGRFEEAAAVLKKALESDPLSAGLHHDLGWIGRLAGQCESAIPEFRQALELDRGLHASRVLLGMCHLHAGKTNEALEELRSTVQLSPDSAWARSFLGYAYGLTGQREEAMRMIGSLDELARRRYVTPSSQATVYGGLGQSEQALDLLEQAYRERHIDMVFLKVEPVFGWLRNEPRFQDLLRRVENGGREPVSSRRLRIEAAWREPVQRNPRPWKLISRAATTGIVEPLNPSRGPSRTST